MFPIGDDGKLKRKPIVNWFLIGANTLIFIYSITLGDYQSIINSYGLTPADFISGKKLYTFFTSMFLHAGPIHLAGNMLYLYIFGDNVEDQLGHTKYLLLYFISAFGADILHIFTLTSPQSFLVPAVGASGAISGILGAFLILCPRVRIKVAVILWFFIVIPVRAHFFIAAWFVYQLLMSMLGLFFGAGGIAWFAHIGGFMAGYLLAILFIRTKRKKEKKFLVLYR
ncbi:MAG: rhomboid family intramembrane serine protease [Thermoprotei archaeon]|nr:MAG: rhomboid family intramembrane serine protease [Thermoprotei archaeon]